MGKRLIIDGDVFLYRFSWANQYKVHWEEGVSSEVLMPFVMARDQLDTFLKYLLRVTACDDYIIALSHPKDFRYMVDATYQAGRAERPSPKYKEDLLKYIVDNHSSTMLDWLEGDDVLGLHMTEHPEEVVAATIDKDLFQIPGWLYNWNLGRLQKTDHEVANEYFFAQVLAGDATDGVKGIPGVGMVKAMRFLDDVYGKSEDVIWQRVLDIYDSKGLSPEYALRQARLVRILRKGEYDYDRRKPKLWDPPTGNHGGDRKENS